MPPPSGASTGAVEGKHVNDLALAWAAGARKLQQRADQLKRSVEAAYAAGTPNHVLLSALSGAEYGSGGVKLPHEVWQAAGFSS
jgi:hypothetical protein